MHVVRQKCDGLYHTRSSNFIIPDWDELEYAYIHTDDTKLACAVVHEIIFVEYGSEGNLMEVRNGDTDKPK